MTRWETCNGLRVDSEHLQFGCYTGLPISRGAYGTAFVSSTDDGVTAPWSDSLGSGIAAQGAQSDDEKRLGSDDPTKAAFPFLHGLALSEAGHSVQIFLLGEAVSLMRKSLAGAVVPVGWPPLEETLNKVAARHIPIYACGACSRARSVAQTDLDQWGAKFGSPTIFVSLVEWADRVITE